MNWFWYFTIYSFLGFLLEAAFALLLRERPDRKCFLVLPLCPVYGFGACACLLLAPLAKGGVQYILCAAVCTVIEYAMAGWYERCAGVRFWDYTGIFGNLRGRVCLPFSAAWGLLALILVNWIHPMITGAVSSIPACVTFVAVPVLLADGAASHLLLRRTRDCACLRWYDAVFTGKERFNRG